MPLEAEDARKLDTLGTQISSLLVQVATIAANVGALRDDIGRQGSGHDDHETRIREIERLRLQDLADRVDRLDRFRWKVAGAFSVLGAVAGAAGTLLTQLIHHL